MRKLNKSKAGFSLVEMVLVIAIIVILAAVLGMSISAYISSAQSRSARADASRRSAVVNIRSSEANMRALGFGNASGGGSAPAST